MAVALLPRGVRIEGIVRCDGDLVIEGEVDGSVVAGGRVTVAAQASCRGEVFAPAALVLGELIGDAMCRERVEVGPGGRVVGNLRAPEIAVDPTAQAQGTIALASPEPRPIATRRRPALVRGPGLRRPRPPLRVTEVVPDDP